MRKSNQLIAALLASAVLSAQAPAACADTQTAYAFDLPAENLGDALRAVASRTGLELYASAAEVNGVAAPRLQGTLTARQAIERLLIGTGLVVRFTDGAAIIRGRSQADAADDAPGPEIVVTGTHIRGATPTARVQTIHRDDIAQQGDRDLGDFIRSLPENFSGGQNPGVAGGGDQGDNENSSSSSTLNLRGLGPAATLTLMNGHRLAYDTTSQGVDISQIPLAAIDRVEIVTDGSSALYGSDAVGGVANVILRRDYQGALMSARLGASTEGGDTQQQYDLVTGSRWDSGGFMVAGSYSDTSAITAHDRSYTQNLDGSSTLVPWQRQYSLVAAGHQTLSDRLTLEFDAQYNERISQIASPFLTTSDVTSNGLLSRPDVQSGTVSATLRWALSPSWTLSGTGTYGISNNHILSRTFSGGSELFFSRLNYDNELASGELVVEGVLAHLPGGTARLALGGGYRHAGLNVFATQESGGFTSTTNNITSGRDVYFGYGELSIPMVGEANHIRFIDDLQIDLAGRYEDYPGNAHLATPKIGLLYRPDPAVTIRAGWGTSFKTQTLYQQYQAREADLLPSFYFPGAPSANPVLILAGGNANLKPERATTWSADISLKPAALPGLELQASWFDIRYRDRVVSPVTDLLSAFTDPVYASYVTLAPSAAQVTAATASVPQGISNQTGAAFDAAAVGAIINTSYQNAERQHVRGLDLAAHYKIELARDNFVKFEGSATYLKSDQQLSAGFPLQQLAGIIFNPPHWHGRLGGTWEQDNFTVSAYGSYIGGTTDNRYLPYAPVGSFTTLDLVGQLRSQAHSGLVSAVVLTLTVQNLLDAHPAPIRNAIPTDPPYDSTNTSVAGRVVSIALSKAF